MEAVIGSAPQLHVGRKPARALLDAPVGWLPSGKPAGGVLWTSTYVEGIGSAWTVYAGTYRRGRQGGLWIVEPAPDCKVLTIETPEDHDELVRRFGGGSRGSYFSHFLNWPEIAARYDGLRLVDPRAFYSTMADSLGLWGWDCESTVWFNWAFAGVRRAEFYEERTLRGAGC